ncbi:MAG: class IV adenylate cyclase [Deltaproteobacteria bacterium]|nr:class IV adenylate cyclase [Deltaproteobacteria bacterium]
MAGMENRELELKFVVHHPGAMRHAILHLGAEGQGEIREINYFFDNSEGTLNSSGRRLRLRRTEHSIITYKERPEHPLPGVKDMVELETEVTDVDQMRKILLRLGFQEVMIYEKYRETFNLGDIQIVLDRMPIGTFMEIEGQRSRILSVSRRLGLDPDDAISIGYPEMILIVCQAEGLDSRNCTFELFPESIDPDKYHFPRMKGR